MLTTLALASTLWAASMQERPVPASAIVPVEQIADAAGRDIAWVVGAHAADLYSTAYALEKCDGACEEANPLGFNPEARIALKMAVTASTGIILWKLRRDGHGKAATIIRWVVVAGHAALVANNINQARKR